MTNLVRRELASIDPELPFYRVRTMDEWVSLSLVDRRTPMILALGFAAVALLLAAIGLYGVLAYQVGQRTREIGIRMALGAATSSIFGMVLKEGAAIVSIGAGLGMLGAYLLRQTLQSQLYEIGAMNPVVIAAVAGLLLAVALMACLLPARKAARTGSGGGPDDQLASAGWLGRHDDDAPRGTLPQDPQRNGLADPIACQLAVERVD